MEESRLVEQARTDPAAFALLYDLTLPAVYRYALSLTRSHPDAEDATAETYRRALLRMGSYEHRGQPVTAWLCVICRNIIRDRWRRERRESLLLRPGAPVDEWPGAGVVAQEEACAVRAMVARLTPVQQRVVVLRYGQRLSCAEVGERLGKTEAAIKQLSHRAITRLRVLMREAGYDGRG